MPGNSLPDPIGVFDSGLGGLTVVKALMRTLPREDIIYYGDTARVPYGTKSKDTIVRFSCENVRVLLRYHVKMVVVACNSSSSYAIEVLRQQFDVPVCGVIDPGASAALRVSRNRRIGVLATRATVQSQAYTKAIYRRDNKVQVFEQACPLFVPLVEEGWGHTKVAEMIAQEYLSELKRQNVDTLILGCTHYPLLKQTIQKVMGQDVVLVDSAQVMAQEAAQILKQKHMMRTGETRQGSCSFFVSDRPQAFEKIAGQFLGRKIKSQVI